MVLLLSAASQAAIAGGESPIYGVTIPQGYREWQMIAPAAEAAPLDELRVVLGNPLAIKAIKNATQPFPDGTILVKLAYKKKQSDDFAPALCRASPPPCRSW